MSTALTTHHRFTDPIAAAVAVTVIVGGAALIGVALAQPDDVAAPSTPSAPAQVAPNPPSRVGQGDFAPARARRPARRHPLGRPLDDRASLTSTPPSAWAVVGICPMWTAPS